MTRMGYGTSKIEVRVTPAKLEVQKDGKVYQRAGDQSLRRLDTYYNKKSKVLSVLLLNTITIHLAADSKGIYCVEDQSLPVVEVEGGPEITPVMEDLNEAN